MTAPLDHQLAAYLAHRHSNAVVSDFDFLVSGFESELYTFCLQLPKSTRKNYILRLFTGEGATEKLLREARGLSLLGKAGYPVPGLLLQELDVAIFGEPFEIIEKLEGQALWPALATVESGRVNQLLSRFASLLAQLHKLDWRSFLENSDTVEKHPLQLLEESIAHYRSLYRKYDLEGFLQIVDWLDAHKHEISVRPSAIHQDFHANNVLLSSEDQLFVIDWTQFAVSDYRIDLCWTLMIMGDLGNADWGKLIFDSYASEFNVPIEHLEYFNVLAYMKLLASTVIAFTYGPDEVGLRPNAIQLTSEHLSIYKQFSQRVQNITRLTVPELEKVLNKI